ncbi:hypothetical protein E3N88_13783 [Mikania micrantha]|uniref:Uncharacterized protein n=1 Tax=Mikania micrantha TaxID=192012 RepID=A0A5N6P1L5_9ASTR|nr:hypothetical protein E3N88_13783 [Mikania micrantha]
MDMFFAPIRKDARGRQQTINEVCRKELRNKALSSSEEVDDFINGQLTKYQNAEGVFGLPATIRQRSKKTPASGTHEPFHATRSPKVGTGRGDDEAGPSRKDKGKHVLYDEDEIEEDIGLTDVE